MQKQTALVIGAGIGGIATTQPARSGLGAEHGRARHFRRLGMHNLFQIIARLQPVPGPADGRPEQIRVEAEIGVLLRAHGGDDALHRGVASGAFDGGGKEGAVIRLPGLVLREGTAQKAKGREGDKKILHGVIRVGVIAPFPTGMAKRNSELLEIMG